MCQARVKTTSFVIPTAAGEPQHIAWRTKPCSAETGRSITTDDGDTTIPICTACIKRYITKHKPETTWLGWFDGSVPKDAPIFDSHWFWWRVYEGWLSKSPFDAKTRQVTRQELLEFIGPIVFGSDKDKDNMDTLTNKLSSCSITRKNKKA